MTEIIVTFKLKAMPDDMAEFSNDEINDMFKEIAEKNNMDLVSWGTLWGDIKMNIRNIEGIMESKIWKKIKANKGYRGYKIIDADYKPQKKRNSGQFFVLLVFFHYKVRDKTILDYHEEGCKVKKREGYEGLDSPKIHTFYGTLKMLNFSWGD